MDKDNGKVGNLHVLVKVYIEGIPLNMELDTGAAVSLLPFSVYQAKFQHLHMYH